jgi:hypothetical protein
MIHQMPQDDEAKNANSAAYLSDELDEVEDADEDQSSLSRSHSPGVLNTRDKSGWGRGGPTRSHPLVWTVVLDF